jgi:hypothetical protein
VKNTLFSRKGRLFTRHNLQIARDTVTSQKKNLFRSERFIFFVALRVGKESMECKELPYYFTPGPGKVFIGCPADGKKFLKKFRE